MLPKKLKDDAIIEALCELRFDADEQPEIVIGRLSDHGSWKAFSKGRLPVADIPPPIRSADSQLKYQPVLQLRSSDGTHLVKVGSNVISRHNVRNYCGWEKFEPQLTEVFKALFESISNIRVTRLGFRYVNAITSTRHFISGIWDLALDIKVAGNQLQEPINLNYLSVDGQAHTTMTRIASPQFVTGELPKDTTVVVDIDVSSPPNFVATDLKTVTEWTKKAHDFEKDAFFKLIPKSIQHKLVER
jgi:uncharacterized protein (TIGR04255 family)